MKKLFVWFVLALLCFGSAACGNEAQVQGRDKEAVQAGREPGNGGLENVNNENDENDAGMSEDEAVPPLKCVDTK